MTFVKKRIESAFKGDEIVVTNVGDGSLVWLDFFLGYEGDIPRSPDRDFVGLKPKQARKLAKTLKLAAKAADGG